MLKLKLTGVPEHLLPGLGAVTADLDLCFSPDGIPVTAVYGNCLRAELSETGGQITFSKDAELFRGLMHLSREGVGCAVEEHCAFDKNGLMLDVSRNGVMKVDGVKFLLRRMALMGLNLFMLYTEDTFEVEGYPYFGYMRGGYTKAELKELDDYAYSLGIEMMPCIQTLGHSSKILRWTMAMGEIADTGDVLLVGEEKTYRYIEQIMKDASEPYRSKRIHIGMDEAEGLGKGRYKTLHGERRQYDIFCEHMARVQKIAEKLGLHPMVWSDMYFLGATGENDYNPDFRLSDEDIAKIPKDVDVVYWDYYHHKQEFFDGVIREHQRTGAHTLFAGGLWNWSSPAVNTDFMLSTSVPALRACKECGVKEIFTTAWGDNGTQSSIYNLLFGMQLYAEFGYTGEYRPEELDARFEALNRTKAGAYRALGRFNGVPGTDPDAELPTDISEWLLYEDPLCLYFEKDLEGLPLYEHYRVLHEDIARYRAEMEAPEQKLLWEFHDLYSDIMAKKCYWRENAPAAVKAGDREKAAEFAVLADDLYREMCDFHECWYRLWHDCNTPWGWDVIDLRMGGLCARMKTAARLMHDFAEGRAETVPQMAVTKLPYAPQLSWWYRQGHGKVTHMGVIPLAQTSQDV